MGLARSTYYDAPKRAADDTALVEAAICDAFEAYGWRRVQAALGQQGWRVNHKKVRRLMRAHDLQPRVRRRYVTATDSDHESPIFPNLARDIVPNGPNQLWVADLTYVAVMGGFVYVAIILDAWSRRVVGYSLGRSVDARLPPAALRAAIERRRSALGLTHHTDRGSQYAAEAYRKVLVEHGIVGSMGRSGNPYDNAKEPEAQADGPALPRQIGEGALAVTVLATRVRSTGGTARWTRTGYDAHDERVGRRLDADDVQVIGHEGQDTAGHGVLRKADLRRWGTSHWPAHFATRSTEEPRCTRR